MGEDKIKAAVLQLLAALQEKFGKAVLRRLSRFEVYVHDLKRVAAIDPGGQSCEFRDANAENAVSARYTMCSQVLWYTSAHTWGWGTTAVSGMYLDREFKNKGEDKLLNRAIDALSTDLYDFSSPKRALRTLGFFWAKKFELLYRYLGSSAPLSIP